MSSEISTDKHARDNRLQAWQFFLLLAMAAATWGVLQARDTQPASLLLLSAAILAAGGVAIAIHYALLGFLGIGVLDNAPLDRSTRRALEQEKGMVLRSIKELEFDRAMRKVSDADFVEIDRRLRARALALMEQLEAPVTNEDPPLPPKQRVAGQCPSCDAKNDTDARFCKACGQRLADA